MCRHRALKEHSSWKIIAEWMVVFGSVYQAELRFVLARGALYRYSSPLTHFNVVSGSDSIFSQREATAAINPGKKIFSFQRNANSPKQVSVVELACCWFKPRPQTGVGRCFFFK